MTEQTNIPKPVSPLPWRADNRTDLLDAEGGEVAYAYPNEGGGFVDERDALYAAWAANNAPKLYELLSRVCKYLDGGGHIEANSDAHMDIDELLKAARGEK